MAPPSEPDTRVSDRSDVAAAHAHHRLRVERVIDETHDTRSYVLGVPSALEDVFRYQAGQFCSFRVTVDGEEHHRCYSMSSAPGDGPDLTVTVKRVPGGVVSNWLLDHVAGDDILEVQKPAGRFCLRDDATTPIVAYCGGSGVTPVMSIVRAALATTARPIRVLYANRDERSVIFHDALRQLEEEHPDRLEVHFHVDADSGYLDSDDVLAFLGDEVGADHYLCGPAPFMDLVEGALREAGVDDDRIFLERFEPVTPADDPEAGGEGDAEAPERITLIFKGSRHTIDYTPGDTILQTARRGGLAAPFSCEAGNCATCMALVHDGTARMRVNDALTDDEVEEGWVLTCQALPEGTELTVEYESF